MTDKAPLRPKQPHAHTASGRDIAGFWAWFERLVLMATFFSIILGVWAYNEQRALNRATLHEIEEARADRKADATTRAWNLLTTPAAGNSGKGPALEYLNQQRIRLDGIDLSCAAMGGVWRAEEFDCIRGAYLGGIDLSRAILTRANLDGVNLYRANLTHARLRQASLQGAFLILADLTGAQMSKAKLDGASLSSSVLIDADLTGASFRTAFMQDADLSGAQLSQADFTRAYALDGVVVSNPDTGKIAWAWADRRPIGAEDLDIALCLYPDHRPSRATRPDPCLPPAE